MNEIEESQEMARDIPSDIVSYNGNPKGLHLYFEQKQEIAQALYEKCYRNCKDKVVLSREEYENLGLVVETIQEYETVNGQPKLINEKKIVKKLKTDFTDLLNQEIRELQIAQARKETAEKFAQALLQELELLGYDESDFSVMAVKVLAKQFGMEVEE